MSETTPTPSPAESANAEAFDRAEIEFIGAEIRLNTEHIDANIDQIKLNNDEIDVIVTDMHEENAHPSDAHHSEHILAISGESDDAKGDVRAAFEDLDADKADLVARYHELQTQPDGHRDAEEMQSLASEMNALADHGHEARGEFETAAAGIEGQLADEKAEILASHDGHAAGAHDDHAADSSSAHDGWFTTPHDHDATQASADSQ